MGNASSARRHNIEPPPPAAVVVEQDADGSSLFSLKYASVLSGSEQDTEQGIAGIITSSLKNNTARGITGMLYHDPSTKAVVQVVEGPRDAVQRLYEKIQCDTRHTGCRIISQRLVPARAYADFGMALARTTGDVEQLISEAETPQHSFAEHLVRIQYTSTLLAPNEEQVYPTPPARWYPARSYPAHHSDPPPPLPLQSPPCPHPDPPPTLPTPVRHGCCSRASCTPLFATIPRAASEGCSASILPRCRWPICSRGRRLMADDDR